MMIRRVFIKLTIIIACVEIINSCCDKEEYDWNKVEPGQQIITALEEDTAKLIVDTILGNNYNVKTYKAIPRGGSSYDWVVSSNILKISVRTDKPYIVDIKAESGIDTFAWLKVSERTHSGKIGLPDSVKIYVMSYCEFDINQLIGNGKFISKMTNYAPYNTIITTKGNDTIINNNFFNMRWKVKYYISNDYEQKIKIVPGQEFIYNGEPVEVKGEGYYNTCKSLIIVNFGIYYLYGINDVIPFGSGIDSLQLKKN